MMSERYLRLLRNRLINRSFHNASLDTVVKDLLAHELADLHLIPVSLPKAVKVWRLEWAGVNAARVFSDIARQVGLTWDVNDAGQLAFRARTPEEEIEHRRQIAEHAGRPERKGERRQVA